MARALWRVTWKGNRLELTNEDKDHCLTAYKNGQTLQKWCLDSELTKKLYESLETLLSGKSISYVNSKHSIPFCMSLEKVVGPFLYFEFCKGCNINIGSNCILLITTNTHLRKLQVVLNQVSV